ncbi:MAG: efflux RND transporter periplasmic adaptor subunit [Bacteroidetes bacterium]|nr:efflux RND transporter periplasmic adaptor subunit [Bacteroidota bacterium]
MKNYLIATMILIALASCGTGNDKNPLAAKQAQLTDLKKQQADLKEKINKLENELAAADTSQKETKSKFVSVTEMIPQSFSHYVEVQAKVDGDEDVTVSPEMPGTVTAVLVKTGDRVEKGQTLATMDDRTIRQSLEALKTQTDMAVTMYNKQKNLWDQKIGSEVQFIQAKTQKEAMEKQYASLHEQWEMTRIKSPINGTVDLVNIKIGQAVAPGIPSVRVVNLSNLKVKGEVAESYISKVKIGNEVILFFPDMNKEIKTRLDYSGQAINTLNRTFNVEVRLNRNDGDFHPNQVVVLKISDYAASHSFVVPVGAVQKSTDGEFVYIAENENGKTIAKRKTVTSGMIYNGVSEIRSGLEKGDKVITTGYQNVIEGDAIKL